MEEKIEDILDNNMMHDGQLNKTKAITELLNLFSVSQQRELLIAYDEYWMGKENIKVVKGEYLKEIDEFLSNK